MTAAQGGTMTAKLEQKICRMGLSDDQFREAAKDIIGYVINHYNTLKGKQPFPDVKPGYMRELIPTTAPQSMESWPDVFKDLDRVVMDGLTHWQSSRFFAFFPTGSSYPAILADVLCDACACMGFSWASSPACTELETVMMDWLAKALDLPRCFWHDGKGPGAGVIQGTIGMVNMRMLPVDANISLRGETLRLAIEEDRAAGKIPFYVCATLGTTSCCSFDNLQELGDICSGDGDIWLHVDAAYAGSSFICPEYRHFMRGLELVDSYNFNPHKWLMVNFDCSALWVKNSVDLMNSFHVNPLVLQHEEQGAAIDYRHWQLPLGRTFRSLKIWFVLRLVGVDGLRERIREDVRLAKLFESYVRSDERFEVVFPVELGLVCMRMVEQKEDPKANREINERLLKRIVDSREIFLVASEVEGIYFLRVSCGAVACDEDAVKNCWEVIKRHAGTLLEDIRVEH